MPAHVTLISPFLDSAHIDGRVIANLERIVGSSPAFDVAFESVGRWPASEHGPGVVWLRPGPGAAFVGLTRAIWAAYPDAPPYGRLDDDLEPHLTIAIDDPARFDAAERAATAHLPFSRRIESAALLVERSDGRWSAGRRFAFGAVQGGADLG